MSCNKPNTQSYHKSDPLGLQFQVFYCFILFLSSSNSELQHVWPDPVIPNTSEASSVESQLFARKPTALKTRIIRCSLSTFHTSFQETCCFNIFFHCHLENTAISFGFRETPKAPSGQDLISDLSDPDQILDMKGHMPSHNAKIKPLPKRNTISAQIR